MRQKSTMMQPTNFSDFNPLDVLAAAASLQWRRSADQPSGGDTGAAESSSGGAQDGEGGEDEDGGGVNADANSVHEVPAATTSVNNDNNTVAPQHENHLPAPGSTTRLNTHSTSATSGATSTTTITPPPAPRPGGTRGPNGARLQLTDHSYAFVSQLQNLKAEEDEGYSSRSSLDDDSDETVSRLNPKNGQLNLTGWGVGAATGRVINTSNGSKGNVQPRKTDTDTAPAAGKATKIVILSKDANLQRLISGVDGTNTGGLTPSTAPTATPGGSSLMLRTLLGQKSAALKTSTIHTVNTASTPSKGHPVASQGHPVLPQGQSKVIIAGGVSASHVVSTVTNSTMAVPNTNDKHERTSTLVNMESDAATLVTTVPASVTQDSSEVVTESMLTGAQQQSNNDTTGTQDSTTHTSTQDSLLLTSTQDSCGEDPSSSAAVEAAEVPTVEPLSSEQPTQPDEPRDEPSDEPCDESSPSALAETTEVLQMECEEGWSYERLLTTPSCGTKTDGHLVTVISAPDDEEQEMETEESPPCEQVSQQQQQQQQQQPPQQQGQSDAEHGVVLLLGSAASSQQGSDVEETSCDGSSSKDNMTVDTVTPVMSPTSAPDLTSPLMSPVCERDVPMMSPMVGSPEVTCDIFKLPNGGMTTNSTVKTVAPPPSVETANLLSAVAVVVDNEEDLGGGVEATDKSGQEHPEDHTDIDSIQQNEQDQLKPEQTCMEPSQLQQTGLQEQQKGEVADNPTVSIIKGSESTQQQTQEQLQQQNKDHLVDELHKLGLELPQSSSTPGLGLTVDNKDTISFTLSDAHGGTDSALSGATTSRNQYIIEDDESPVAKFGTTAVPVEDDEPVSVTERAQTEPTVDVGVSSATVSGKSEPVQVLMTTEPNNKSVFTTVRGSRPVISGVKPLPGSLHMVPVVPAGGTKSGVMHVVPVSGAARGVVTQLIPTKAGHSGQFITGVPVLSGKTVMLPDNAKGRMNTILVPVSVAGTGHHHHHAAPISLVQTSKSKLAALQPKTATESDTKPQLTSPLSKLRPEISSSSSPHSKQMMSPLSKPRSELSSPLLFHGRITPVSSTSDTSELLSSPESSLHSTGFSGLIMGGRATPDLSDSAGRPASRTSLDNPKDKISLKISSNSVMESDDSMSSEPPSVFTTAKKETIGIGMMGSLSWKTIDGASPRGLTRIGRGGSGREFVRIQGGELRTVDDEDALPPLEKTLTKRAPGRTPKDGKTAGRKKKALAAALESAPPPPPPVLAETHGPTSGQLHPLIDHDYCMFTEFNAQIQSSIIATTETKTKVEKKYAKKTKAVRTKAVRGLITEESLKVVSKVTMEKLTKGRRGRLKKHRVSKDKAVSDEELSLDGNEEFEDAIMAAAAMVTQDGPIAPGERTLKTPESIVKPSRTSERRAKLQAIKDDKNYVKITGSYQDEFVYFATKNKRNRPRKSLDDPNNPNNQLVKQPQVGGMTVFDWYKDLSKTMDKTSRFGTPTTSSPSSPVPAFMMNPTGVMEVTTEVSTTPAVTIPTSLTTSSSGTITTTSATLNKQPPPTSSTTPPPPTPNTLSTPTTTCRSETTPTHESEVADLVCHLSEINSLAATTTTAGPAVSSDMDLSPFMIGGQEVMKTTESSTSGTASPVPGGQATLPTVTVNEMAEQVREMLNSMGADELDSLELKFGEVDGTGTGMTDTSFDGLLGNFNQEVIPTVTSNQTTSNNLCDLDEINDSDLLQSDLGILQPPLPPSSNSLKTSASAPALPLLDNSAEQLPTPDTTAAPYGLSKTLEFTDVKLDKSELFPEVSEASAPPRIAPLEPRLTPGVSSSSPSSSSLSSSSSSTAATPTTATPATTTADVSRVAANTAPELTLVSMYWNDLPGLMLCGQQYVRLVDIHKQVLPAKDTGILKKRCQMMGLSIANCSELQRDFLIRYANAAKSKSTVIVCKEAAQTLIGFYVEPKTRPSKQAIEERGIQLAQQARAAHAAAAAAKAAGAATPNSPHPESPITSSDVTQYPPVSGLSRVNSVRRVSTSGDKTDTTPASIRRKRRLTSTGSVGSDGGSGSSSPAGVTDVKRSARLRHKMVNYSDMLLGNHYEIQEALRQCNEAEQANPTPTLPPPPPGGEIQNHVQSTVNITDISPVTALHQRETAPGTDDVIMSQENVKDPVDRMLFPEDIEIRKLKLKMRVKNLNPKEKRRLRRLREKVRKREMKRKQRERRKVNRMNGRNTNNNNNNNTRKPATMTTTAVIANIVKTKKELEETHLYNKKYDQEHCYAAAPVSPDKETILTGDENTEDHLNNIQTSTQKPAEKTSQVVQDAEDDSSDTTEISPEVETMDTDNKPQVELSVREIANTSSSQSIDEMVDVEEEVLEDDDDSQVPVVVTEEETGSGVQIVTLTTQKVAPLAVISQPSSQSDTKPVTEHKPTTKTTQRVPPAKDGATGRPAGGQQQKPIPVVRPVRTIIRPELVPRPASKPEVSIGSSPAVAGSSRGAVGSSRGAVGSSRGAVARLSTWPAVAVIHRDAVQQRLSQRSRWQDGSLHVSRLTEPNAPCITCTTCGEAFSVKRFLKHMHHQNNRDELAHVTLSQVLELRSGDQATQEERDTWTHFEALREKLANRDANKAMARRVRTPSVSPQSECKPEAKRTLAIKTTKTEGVKRRSPVTLTASARLDRNSPVAVARAVVKAVTAAAAVVNNCNKSVLSGYRGTTIKPSAASVVTPPASAVTSPASARPKVQDGRVTSSTAPPVSQRRTVTLARNIRAAAGARTKSPSSSLSSSSSSSPSPVVSSPLLTVASSSSSSAPAASACTTPSSSDSNPLVRHSTRVRKQKQLHPIEKYVFSNGTSPPSPESPSAQPPPTKRARLDTALVSGGGNHHRGHQAGVVTPTTKTSSSGRKVRLRLSTGGKYDLRAPPLETGSRQ